MTTLAELRRANLEEQRTPEPTPNPSANTEMREAANEDLRTSATPEARTEVRKQVHPDVRQDVSKAVRQDLRQQVSPHVSESASTDFLERVRNTLAQKKTHAGGVKTTVEMTPELNRRAKQYCLDHGNLPVRQVFLELMAAFLDEEGY